MPSREERQQIRDEIAALKDERQTLKESIRFHLQQSRRNADGYFGGRDLETRLSQVQSEISALFEKLKG